MDEETIIDQKEAQKQSANKEVKKNDKDALKGKKKITTSARIATAAFVGGVAANHLFTPMKVFPNASVEGLFDSNAHTDGSEPAPVASTHLVGHDMPVASEVNDSLNYNEAFAAARKATGPGGLFVWHGHTYGTYYKNEWDAMSQEEQDQYWANVHHTSQQIHYEEPESGTDSELDIEQDSGLVEVELDSEADEILEPVEEEVASVDSENEDDIEVSIDENEVVEMDDEEPIEVSIDDEAEVLLDDVDESDDIELAVETEDEFFDDQSLIDVDTDELDDVIDENDIVETDDEIEIPDDLLDGQDEEYATENADIDDSATTSFDPEIDIDNDMDMSEFS